MTYHSRAGVVVIVVLGILKGKIPQVLQGGTLTQDVLQFLVHPRQGAIGLKYFVSAKLQESPKLLQSIQMTFTLKG